MLVIAIETSGSSGTVALSLASQDQRAQSLGERRLRLQQRHAQTLVADIRELLIESGRRAADCGLVAVSIGPGSFTGLRVGVVCAKVLAYACHCPVVAIEAPLVIAEAAPADVTRLQVVQDAQRQELFLTRFARDAAGIWEREGPIQIVPADRWLAELEPGDCVSGPALERLASRLPAHCRMLEPELWQPRASRLAEVGLREFQAGRTCDPVALEPLYIRPSAAEEKRALLHPAESGPCSENST